MPEWHWQPHHSIQHGAMASIFTRIIAGEIPGAFVHHGPAWVGLLDRFPVAPGHLLLIPRRECPLLANLDADSLAALGPTVAAGTACLTKALGCDAVSVLVRDGAAAGQEVPHVHVHLIPRTQGDRYHDFAGGSYGTDDAAINAAMAAMAERLSAAWPG